MRCGDISTALRPEQPLENLVSLVAGTPIYLRPVADSTAYIMLPLWDARQHYRDPFQGPLHCHTLVIIH